jgi:hypothetical protein
MKMDTNTLLIGVVAVAGIYLLTRPKTPTYLPTTVSPTALSTLQPNYAGNPTAQDISAGGTALAGMGDLIGNIFP